MDVTEAIAIALASARRAALEDAARVVEDMAAYYREQGTHYRPGDGTGNIAEAIASTMYATLPHRIRALASPAPPASGVPSGSREPTNGNAE